jgi:hypothetical protein
MTPTIDQLLTLLTSRKIFDGASWHIYDEFGGELTYGPDHWGGVHWALLNAVALAVKSNNGWPAETVQGSAGYGTPKEVNMKGYVDRLNREREAYNLTRLHADDEDATAFVLSLFEMEFL